MPCREAAAWPCFRSEVAKAASGAADAEGGRAGADLATQDPGTGALVARLPNGGTLELLALSDPESAPNGWWRPDGTVLTNLALEVENLGQVGAPKTQSKRMILRYQYLPEGASSPQLEFRPLASYSGGGRVDLDGKPQPRCQLFQVAFPDHLRTATLVTCFPPTRHPG